MTKKKTAHALGKWGEDLAKSFLEDNGYEVIHSNYYTEYGEIDLIAKKNNRLHFVEVKTRGTKNFGHPEEAITKNKLAHMLDSAQAYLQAFPDDERDWQIDVLAIQTASKNEIPDIRFFQNVQG